VNDLDRAIELHEEFREKRVDRAIEIVIEPPKVLMNMGVLTALEYRTTHGHKVVLYRHDFAPGSRPMLAAGKGRGHVYLVGNRFGVTDRGITDYGPTGKAVDYTPPHRCPTCLRPAEGGK
jgi:hypothetical protein